MTIEADAELNVGQVTALARGACAKVEIDGENYWIEGTEVDPARL